MFLIYMRGVPAGFPVELGIAKNHGDLASIADG